jgi:cytochrome c556
MRKRLSTIALVYVLGATLAFAQNTDIIKQRKGHYEEMGKAVKEPTAMFKGEAPFDLAKVQAALKVIQTKAAILPTLFPEDSKKGGKTEALPAIWKNKADFEERFKKLAAAAKAAETSITDEASHKVEWPQLGGNCSGCHKKYRKEKK